MSDGSFEPRPPALEHDLKYWLDSGGELNASLDHTDNATNPFKKLEARRWDWDDDNTLKLKDNAFASSGAIMAVPKDGHWIRIFVQANNWAFYFLNQLSQRSSWNLVENKGIDVELDDRYEIESPQIIAVGAGESTFMQDGYFEFVLIGRPNQNPRDIFALDIDEDWGWSYQGVDVQALRVVLNGNGGSDGSNLEGDAWFSLVDYGTTDTLNGAIIPRTNSKGNPVNAQGVIVNVPNGFYWDWETQATRSIENNEETDFGTGETSGDTGEEDGTTGNNEEEDDPIIPPARNSLHAIYDELTNGATDVPFSVINIFGKSSQHSWPSDNILRINNNDIPYRDSGAALLEVREGYWVEVNIKNENDSYFNAIGASLSLDPALQSEDFAGGDSDFTVRLYGGAVIWMDPDDDYSDASAAFGGSFYIATEKAGYSISDPADNDYEIKLKSWGIDEREPPIPECPAGFVLDPLTLTCIPIGGGGGGGGGSTDPFDLIDGVDTPFDEDDGLFDRLIKSVVFGINGSFRAIEAAFEGFVIALPALIIIGSAVVVAQLTIKATEKGAVKVVGVAKKAKGTITNVEIEGIN